MNLESDLMQYYINRDKDIKENYYIREILEPYEIDSIFKNMNVDIATIFKQLGHKKKADSILKCDSLKYLKQCLMHENHKDYIRSFCRDRYCPICSHIKAHKQTQMLHKLIESMQKDNNYKNCYLLFVTLTFKNVKSSELPEAVDKMVSSVSRMIKEEPLFKPFITKRKNTKGEEVIKKNKPLCIGTIRNIECTSKIKQGNIEHNPHTHMLLLVRKEYWSRKSMQWNNKKLQKIWRKYKDLDYDPVVHITLVRDKELKGLKRSVIVKEEIALKKEEITLKNKKIKKNTEVKKNNLGAFSPSGVLKEISKYETKDTDKLKVCKNEKGELQIDWNYSRTVINALYKAFHRKQTLVFTGEFKKQKQRLFGKKKPEDLIESTTPSEIIDIFKDKRCRKCGSPTKAVLQRFSCKTRQYYDLSDKARQNYENGINNRFKINIINKKTDVSAQTNISKK